MPDNENKADRRRPLEEWTAQQLRLTLFPTEDFEAKPMDWWEQVVGTAPEIRNTRPAQRSFADVGKTKGAQLVNVITPARVDWILSAEEKPDDPTPFSVIGPFPDALREFIENLRDWLAAGAPPVKRLALGAKAHLKVAAREEGNTLLAEYLPSLKIDDPVNETDIVFRINRRRDSKVLSSFMLNRLCTWSVVESVSAQMTLAGDVDKPLDVRPGKPATACQVELDVNTDQHFTRTIEGDELKAVIEELEFAARGLVQEGDVA